MNMTPSDYAAKLQPEIGSCENCQPWDSEEDQPIWVCGIQMEMREFLESRRVPRKFYEDVAASLHCEQCGDALNINCEVGVKSCEEKLYEQRWDEWQRNYDSEFRDFTKWLEQYPYLGGQHKVGREFLDQIRDFPVASYVQEHWWRARRVDSPRELKAEDLGPPPTPPSSEGRYNHHGQCVFYLASDKLLAASEVLKEDESLAWIQQFEVRSVGKIMDLTLRSHPDDLGIESLPMLAVGMNWNAAHIQPSKSESEWKPEYFVPRYIADCARSVGFSGIMFDSHKHFRTNLVLFEWLDDQIHAIGNPEIIQLPRDYGVIRDDEF